MESNSNQTMHIKVYDDSLQGFELFSYDPNS